MTILRIAGKAMIALVLLACATTAGFAQGTPAAAGQTPAATPPGPVQKNIEAYLRNLYAFGPDVGLSVDELKETPVAGLSSVEVHVKLEGNEENAKFYVSKDGKFLFRGELSDLTKDPLAENRASMRTKDAPVMGDAKAPVTIVEYSDFECPVCRSLHDAMRGMVQHYPQVRVVFMDYPLEQIHPWARTAALAGRCTYMQNPAAFWKMYDLIYDNQELIAAGNAYQKMSDYAGQIGLNADGFKGCMAGPEAAAAVDASIANGRELEVQSTPTLFVNGRRLVGADPHALEQYIKYELAKAGVAAK